MQCIVDDLNGYIISLLIWCIMKCWHGVYWYVNYHCLIICISMLTCTGSKTLWWDNFWWLCQRIMISTMPKGNGCVDTWTLWVPHGSRHVSVSHPEIPPRRNWHQPTQLVGHTKNHYNYPNYLNIKIKHAWFQNSSILIKKFYPITILYWLMKESIN